MTSRRMVVVSASVQCARHTSAAQWAPEVCKLRALVVAKLCSAHWQVTSCPSGVPSSWVAGARISFVVRRGCRPRIPRCTLVTCGGHFRLTVRTVPGTPGTLRRLAGPARRRDSHDSSDAACDHQEAQEVGGERDSSAEPDVQAEDPPAAFPEPEDVGGPQPGGIREEVLRAWASNLSLVLDALRIGESHRHLRQRVPSLVLLELPAEGAGAQMGSITLQVTARPSDRGLSWAVVFPGFSEHSRTEGLLRSFLGLWTGDRTWGRA